jgi:glycosyltransferase involved in cell wall biosynthesis
MPLEFYDVNPDKIHVTYQAVNQTPLNCSEEELFLFLRRYSLKAQKYILFVGAIEPKKNIGRLIDAFSTMYVFFPIPINHVLSCGKIMNGLHPVDNN